MRRIVVREAGIYLLLLVAFALLMHPDLIGAPAERFALMSERRNYVHPFLYTAAVYLLLLLLRTLVRGIIKLIRRFTPPTR